MADRQAFEQLVLPQMDTMYRVALSHCRNTAKAEDLVQTTCVKALRRFGSFREGTNIKAWLLRILHNTWIDELRHRKVTGPSVTLEEQILPESSHPDPAREDEDPADLLNRFSDQQVISALLELPDEQRLTLLLTDVEQLSQEDVADITGVAVGTVKSRTSRARNALKERLKQHALKMGFVGRRS